MAIDWDNSVPRNLDVIGAGPFN